MHSKDTTRFGETGDAGPAMPAWKRSLDIALILICAPALLLLGGLVALVIKFGSSGPVLFRQERVGYRGRRFTCYKFRTMEVNAEIESHRRHVEHLIRSQEPMMKLDAQQDPRLVRLGAWLRAGGLDELPQVFNILRGEMSLVGPRPCLPYEYENYNAWHRRRFDAVPGLTGLWQVSGKNRTTFEEMIHLDIEYAERQSIWFDLKILLRTVPALRRQYADLQAARGDGAVAKTGSIGKTIESYRL